jgi:hypothetical protein
MSSITQQALRILEEEKQAAQVEEQKRIAAAKAEAAAKEQAERAVRVQLQAERELARIAAERTLAEEQALAVQAAEAAALQAELARLRARSEIDVLRDEVAQMRAEQMAALKACHLARLPLQEIPLHAFGELDISVKSSKEELAAARGEIAELKALVHSLIMQRAAEFWNVGSSAASDSAHAALKDYVRSTNPQRWDERKYQTHQHGREQMRLE